MNIEIQKMSLSSPNTHYYINKEIMKYERTGHFMNNIDYDSNSNMQNHVVINVIFYNKNKKKS